MGIFRQEVRPFTSRQIELVSNFAAQAVIAIENARLLSELRESLQQQTATADVLKVISSSPGELELVFQAMLKKAVRICEAKFGVMYRYENNVFRAIALHGAAPASFVEARQRHPVLTVIPGTALGRLVANKEAVQIADAQAEVAYRDSPAHAIGLTRANTDLGVSHRRLSCSEQYALQLPSCFWPASSRSPWHRLRRPKPKMKLRTSTPFISGRDCKAVRASLWSICVNSENRPTFCSFNRLDPRKRLLRGTAFGLSQLFVSEITPHRENEDYQRKGRDQVFIGVAPEIRMRNDNLCDC